MKGAEIAERAGRTEGVGKLIVRIQGARLKALIVLVHGVRHVITIDPSHFVPALTVSVAGAKEKFSMMTWFAAVPFCMFWDAVGVGFVAMFIFDMPMFVFRLATGAAVA
jgi:hypothetical protein